MKTPLLLPLLAALVFATVSPAQEPEKPRPEPQEKIEQVKRSIQELRAAGKNDEAAQLEQRLREEIGRQSVIAAHSALAAQREEMGKQGEQPERMRHIAEAIKHLRAAGLNEPAESIERMVREQQKPEGRGREQAAPRESMEQMQRAMREMQEQVQKAFKDTHEQMAKMAQTIDELSQQMAKR